MNCLRSLLVAILMLSPALAHADYPGGTVTIVVPFTTGGSNDSIARYLAEGLKKVWNVPVVVMNRPGAGSAIGTASVATAKPDGHTLLIVTPSLTTKAVLDKTLSYDPVRDIAPIAMVAQGPFVLVAGSKTPAKTIKELQAEKGRMLYGAIGAGSSTHFASALMNSILGIKAEPVFYKGGTDATIDVMGGRIDVYLGTVSQLAGNINENQVKALAVTSPDRDPAIPNVPTLKEAGVDATLEQWWGLFTTGATPADTVAKINKDVNAVLSTPEARAFFGKLGTRPVMEPPGFMKAVVASDLEKWAGIAKEYNIKEE